MLYFFIAIISKSQYRDRFIMAQFAWTRVTILANTSTYTAFTHTTPYTQQQSTYQADLSNDWCVSWSCIYLCYFLFRAFDSLIANRTALMTRHAFLGSGQYVAKWLGDYDAKWDNFRRSIVATVEMGMFGFSMVGKIQHFLKFLLYYCFLFF